MTPLDEAIIGGRNSYLFEASDYVYLEIVKILLKHGAHCMEKQKSFLHLDSTFQKQLATILLEEGVIDLNAVNERGHTLMNLSIWSDAKSILLLLLEKGADCNVKNADGQMAIHFAISMLKHDKSHLDIVNLLLDHHHIDLNVCNNVKDTPLHMAVKGGHLEIVRKLIQKGARFGSRNNESLTPVQVAIIENHTKVAKFFIENGKYIPTVVLQTAVAKGNAPIVKLLLERGEDPNLTENGNITLLDQAVRNGHLQIVQYLIDHGANIEAQIHDSKEKLLHFAAKYASEEIIKELLKNNVQINSLDKDHCTPLWVAVSNGRKEIVKVLIDAGADVNIQDNLKRKPLAIAIENRHGDIAKMIIDKLQEQNENLEPLSRRIKINDECPVCYGPRHDLFVFQPCGHTKICENCCIRIFHEPDGNPTCPICRTRATSYTKIFL